jgi:hypothetical protein
MPSVRLDPISVPFSDDAIQVADVRWSAGGHTSIKIESKRSGRKCLVEFRDDVGIRILSELDLAAFWMSTSKEVLRTTWLFVIRSGGWFDLEATRDDFYMKHQAPVIEFVIVGFQECVSILARTAPTLTEPKEADA